MSSFSEEANRGPRRTPGGGLRPQLPPGGGGGGLVQRPATRVLHGMVTQTPTYASNSAARNSEPAGMKLRAQTALFCAVYRADCLSLGRIVSGDVPSAAAQPYRAPDLYNISGTANYTAVAAEGLASCDIDLVYENSVVGAAGDPAERTFAAFVEKCPGLFNETGATPQVKLSYECSAECVDWLINYGVCGPSLQNAPVCTGPNRVQMPSCQQLVL
jgi:hypothetical protein